MDKKVWAMGYHKIIAGFIKYNNFIVQSSAKEEIQAYASEWQIKLERCMQFTNCGLGIALGDEIKLAFHDCKNYCISGNWYQAFECSNNFHCVGYQRKAEKMGNDACFRINNPSADLYEKICE
ncbi:hypothetical protein T4B_7780 [Trichinella pseudospiralis]|uniref:Uncharacterized protein n=2 Tax=Trichinella pseudospiralis TaxID=6337 RepID=A0A0V1FH93_TRIPS|nr:hypothetical protein T4D_6548 [Trichinella pseudospiralis]KRZ33338.1 hypothetical protein T4B_7780 [Trichinella pseudospiralis]